MLCPHLSCQYLACLGLRRLRVKVQCLGCFFSLIPRSSTKVVKEKERCAKVELSAAFHTKGPLRSSAAPEVSSGRRKIRMHIAETSGIRESGRHTIFAAARAPVAGSLFWCRDRKDTSFSQALHFLVHGSWNSIIRCAQQLWLPPCTWIEGICKVLIDQCRLCQVLRSADLNMSLLLMTNPCLLRVFAL